MSGLFGSPTPVAPVAPTPTPTMPDPYSANVLRAKQLAEAGFANSQAGRKGTILSQRDSNQTGSKFADYTDKSLGASNS